MVETNLHSKYFNKLIHCLNNIFPSVIIKSLFCHCNNDITHPMIYFCLKYICYILHVPDRNVINDDMFQIRLFPTWRFEVTVLKVDNNKSTL